MDGNDKNNNDGSDDYGEEKSFSSLAINKWRKLKWGDSSDKDEDVSYDDDGNKNSKEVAPCTVHFKILLTERSFDMYKTCADSFQIQ